MRTTILHNLKARLVASLAGKNREPAVGLLTAAVRQAARLAARPVQAPLHGGQLREGTGPGATPEARAATSRSDDWSMGSSVSNRSTGAPMAIAATTLPAVPRTGAAMPADSGINSPLLIE